MRRSQRNMVVQRTVRQVKYISPERKRKAHPAPYLCTWQTRQ